MMWDNSQQPCRLRHLRRLLLNSNHHDCGFEVTEVTPEVLLGDETAAKATQIFTFIKINLYIINFGLFY